MRNLQQIYFYPLDKQFYIKIRFFYILTLINKLDFFLFKV